MKYKIERNTVQETLILPLYSRKLCSELYPNLYRDETAVRLIDQIDYDFSVAEKNSRSLMQRFGALEVAMRQCDLAWEVRDYLKTHPHNAPTPVGMMVRCESELTAVDGRKLTFSAVMYDDAGEVGRATHERFIIQNEKFQKKADAKKAAE